MPSPQITQQYTATMSQAMSNILTSRHSENPLRAKIYQMLSQNPAMLQTLVGSALNIFELYLSTRPGMDQMTLLNEAANTQVDAYLASVCMGDPSIMQQLQPQFIQGIQAAAQNFQNLTAQIQVMQQRQAAMAQQQLQQQQQQMMMGMPMGGMMPGMGMPMGGVMPGMGMPGMGMSMGMPMGMGRPIRTGNAPLPQPGMPMGAPMGAGAAIAGMNGGGGFFPQSNAFPMAGHGGSGVGSTIEPIIISSAPGPVKHAQAIGQPKQDDNQGERIGRPISSQVQPATPVFDLAVDFQNASFTMDTTLMSTPQNFFHEAEFMDYKDHATYGLLRPLTIGDSKAIPLTNEQISQLLTTVAGAPVVLKPATGKALQVSDIKPGETVTLGICGTIANDGLNTIINDNILEQLDANIVDLDESAVHARIVRYRRGYLTGKTLLKDRKAMLKGHYGHSEVLDYLDSLRTHFYDDIYRDLILDITDFVNLTMSVEYGITDAKIDSYAIDALDLEEYIKGLGEQRLLDAWSALAKTIGDIFLDVKTNPLFVGTLGRQLDVVEVEGLEGLGTAFEILRLPVPSSKFALGTKYQDLNSSDSNYINYAAVRKSAHPGLYKIFTELFVNSNKPGDKVAYRLIMTQDGRCLSIHKPVFGDEEFRVAAFGR